MIKQSKRIVSLLLVTASMMFGVDKELENYYTLSTFNICTSVTGATIPQFKSIKELEAYDKKNRKTALKLMKRYNVEGCMQVYADLVAMFAAPHLMENCGREAMGAGLLMGLGSSDCNDECAEKLVSKCLIREMKKMEPLLKAKLKKAKPFPKVDKAAQAQKEREKELERQRQIQAEEKERELERQRQIEAQAQAERLEAIEKENRILAMRLAALGEFIWENEYHRIYTESKKDRYTQDLQGCVQEQQENLNALAKETKYFSYEQESDDGEVEIDESIKKQSAYQALAYCVIKPHFGEYETRARQEKWQEIKAEVLDSAFVKGSLAKNESTLNKHIEKLALMIFESSWAEMAEKNEYSDYESVAVSPWFAKDDTTKILIKQTKEPLGKLDTLKAKLFEESNPQYKQCDKDFFRNKKKEECRQNELNSNIKALEKQIENLTKEIQN